MIFFYLRHGDPIYDPDSLTPLGIRQAEALGKRLARYGLDKIYCSTSNRAIMTAQPTCEMLKLEPELLDFANEIHAWRELSVPMEDGSRRFIFMSDEHVTLFHEKEVRDLGDRWYEHPAFENTNCKAGITRIQEETDRFFAALGYEHIPNTGKYKVTKSNDQRVALFAHAGFGLAFLSCLLDIPYPIVSTQFDMRTTGMTVIDFDEQDGYSIPRVLTFSSDAHLYHEGLPMRYHVCYHTVQY